MGRQPGKPTRLSSQPSQDERSPWGAAATTVLIADDDVVERRATRAHLDAHDDVLVVGDCETDTTVAHVTALAPEIVLLDVDPRGPAARRCLRDIVNASVRARIVIVTTVRDPAALFEALAAGASGYLLKENARTRLARAAQEVMDGRVPVDPDVSALMRERLARPSAPATQGHTLTARELTVLRHVAEGMTNEQIAAELVLSPGTVKLHVQHIIAKLGVANRTQAAVFAARQGLLDST